MIKNNRHVVFQLAVLAAAVLGCSLSSAQVRTDKKSGFRFPSAVPAPASNKGTPHRVKLGEMLFFDPRLSGSNWISCATCHNPALGWSDGQPTAIGNGMTVLKLSTPSIVNVAFNKLQMWDGRFASLEEQAVGPMQAPGEMNGSMDQILAKLQAMPGYVRAFEKAYPGEGITKQTLAKAVASFERTVISKNSAFDAWIHGTKLLLVHLPNEGLISLLVKLVVPSATVVPILPMRASITSGLRTIRTRVATPRPQSKSCRALLKLPHCVTSPLPLPTCTMAHIAPWTRW